MKAEHRRNRTVAFRRRFLLGTWLLSGAVILARSAQVQVLEGSDWSRRAAGQHRASTPIPAARGAIYDRNGVPLAVSRERWIVGVAPRELKDADAVRTLLADELGISRAVARRVTDASDPWHQVPGRYSAEVREALDGVRGVYLERRLERFYPHGDLARSVLGGVVDGEGRGGIEEAFDDVLRGVPGRKVVGRNGGGEIPGEVFEVERPVSGGDVRLTLDLDLQEIAEEALAEALAESRARGGDLIVADPRTGEILAMTSVQPGSSAALSTINAPYEPGSTLKPFTVAALLETGTGALEDSVDTGMGYWRVGGHPLRDIRGYGVITLAEALRVSSNIGVAKAARALSPEQQFENLRDFGFGTLTGLGLPGEAPGDVPHPARWSARSPASLAIGYEIAVTPLQMTMAYGALANGGEMMEPMLVRAVRRPGGTPEEVRRPRRVRRVVPSSVAELLAEVLVDVVEGGTGTAARMSSFRVAGKSGTSRVYVPGRGYVPDRYFASFVGFFPAGDPQLLIYVKLDQGERYGGAAAAPVTRATMEAILAARRSPIDRRALLTAARATPATTPLRPEVRFASRSADLPSPLWREDAPAAAGPDTPVPLPGLRGLPARIAVRRLHALGFRVVWEGGGPVTGILPPAGTRLLPGDTVQVRSGGAYR